MSLNKRIPRELKQNFLRYFVLFLLVFVSMSLVVAMSDSTDSINNTIDNFHEENNVEDGEFSVYLPLKDEDIEEINNMGIEIEENFYIDIEEGVKTFRIFEVRNKINLLHADEGKIPTEEREIFLDKNYARANKINVNDSIKIDNIDYKVVGLGSTPDYGYMLKNPSDASSNQTDFSTAFVSSSFDEIKEKNLSKLIYNYSYVLSDNADPEDLKDLIINIDFDYENIKDTYIVNLIEEVNEIRNDLVGGSQDITDAINEIRNANGNIENGLSEIAQTLDNVINSSNINPATYQMILGIIEQQNTVAGALRDTNSGLSEISDGSNELNDGITELVDEISDIDYVILSSFLEAEYNNRINAAENDAAISKTCGMLVGFVISVLIAFMFCIFTLNSIEKESAIIGTLYSLGFLKKQIILHYIITPVLVVAISAICGTLFGFSLVDFMVLRNVEMYSYPNVEIAYPLYLLLYAIVLPIVLVIAVNFFMLNKKLSAHPLKLLCKEHKEEKLRTFKLPEMSFIRTFQIKQLLKESRNSILMLIGLFISIFLMVWGFGIYSSIEYYISHITDNINNEYTYVFSNPVDQLYNKNSDNGIEKAYTESLSMKFNMTETDLDVILLGIDEGSKYFNFASDLNNEANKIYISSSAAIKFGYKTGDIITMSSPLQNKLYAFEIAGETEYGNGLYFFMELGSMLSYFEKEEDYYNTIFSNQKLELNDDENNMLVTLLSKADISEAASTFRESMIAMEFIMIFGSVFIFILVMFLLMKLAIDNSTYHISLIKTFGYNEKEVRTMYLNGTNIIVVLAIILGLTLGHYLVSVIYPLTVSDVAAGMPFYLAAELNLVVIAISLFAYIITKLILQRRLKAISVTEILKDRE